MAFAVEAICATVHATTTQVDLSCFKDNVFPNAVLLLSSCRHHASERESRHDDLPGIAA